jgi:hypothetical protein
MTRIAPTLFVLALLGLAAAASAAPADIVVFGVNDRGGEFDVLVERVIGLNAGLASYEVALPETASITNTGDQASFIIDSTELIAGHRDTPADVGIYEPVALGYAQGPAGLDPAHISAAVFEGGAAVEAVPVWLTLLLDVPFETSLGSSLSGGVFHLPLGTTLAFEVPPGQAPQLQLDYNFYLQRLIDDASVTVAEAEGMETQFVFDTPGRHDVELWVLRDDGMPYFPAVMKFDVAPEPATLLAMAAGFGTLLARRRPQRAGI